MTKRYLEDLPQARPSVPDGCGSTESGSGHSLPNSIHSRFVSTRTPRAPRSFRGLAASGWYTAALTMKNEMRTVLAAAAFAAAGEKAYAR